MKQTIMVNLMALSMLALIAFLLPGCMKQGAGSSLPEYSHNRFQKVEASLTEPLDIELMSFGSIDEINRYVNQEIAYVREPKGTDNWQEPNLTLDIRSGDCEDFALLKMALIKQRFPSSNPRLLFVRLRNTSLMHAVVVIQDSVVLDNKFNYGLDLHGPTFNSTYIPQNFVRSSR